MIANIEEHRKSAKWLQSTLTKTLLPTVSPDDGALEQQRLDTILQRYRDLLPAVELTTTRSSIVVQSYDYKEDLDRETQWLQVAAETAEEMSQEAPALDDVSQVLGLFNYKAALHSCSYVTSKLASFLNSCSKSSWHEENLDFF